jgi:hypothetical protein
MWINSLGINNCKAHYENYTALYRQECRIMAWTYLNSPHLGAPHEYILHGLDPGLDWASFWPSTPRVFHVATTHSISCFSGFTLTPSLLSGSLLINVQANNKTTLYDTHGHTYTSHRHYYSSFLLSSYTSSTFLGRPVGPDPSCQI